MCDIVNLVTPGSLSNRYRVSSSDLFLSIGKTKCTSDNSCRGTADSAMLRNQSYPHYLFLFLQSSCPIKSTYTTMSSRAPSSY
ncbi:unnamed protein product [Hymenolepis diminuta]|uniref:Uncharacterized protein n=1 Tax=Hymenolepis diminuta TaxID=6216 RepID=A0A564Y7P1_HYMDI|nr:unnamed protein product [Hymenolepis diminuta]